jgi:hypothetical protein
MTRLLGVELTRLRWRRAVVLLVAACVLVPACVWAGVAWNTRPVTPEELAAAQARAEEDSRDPMIQEQLRDCVDNPRNWGIRAADAEVACEQAVTPQPEWYLSRTPLDLREQMGASGTAVVTLLAVLLMLAGTTYVGHDWNSRSMSNQLLFEPRRLRVWLAKGAVVLGLALIVAAAVLTAYWASLWLLAETREVVTPDRVIDLIQGRAGRGTLLIGGAALGAYALTMLFRNTVATVGVLFALTVATPILLSGIGFSGNERWMLHTNVAAVLADGTLYYDDSAADGTVRLSLAGGAGYLGALLLLAIVPSLWSFTTRDVP